MGTDAQGVVAVLVLVAAIVLVAGLGYGAGYAHGYRDAPTEPAHGEGVSVTCTLFEANGEPAAICFASRDVDIRFAGSNATASGNLSLSGLPEKNWTA